jgi:hypothetical protein
MEATVRSRVILLSILAILPGHAAAAQAQNEYGTPEAAADAVLRADSVHDWRLLLAMAHPDALKQRKQEQLEFLTIADLPQMPYQDPCVRKQFEGWRRMLIDSVYRVPSIDSLKNLAPDTLFARDQRFYDRWARQRAGEDSFAPTKVILGHVLANDSTAYVVLEFRYRTARPSDWPSTKAEIMTFRRYQNAWRTMLDPDLGETMGGIAMSPQDCQ